MKFQRYGNAFVAQPEPGITYCVSYYQAVWQAYVTTPELSKPKKVSGLYGFPKPEEAMTAADKHYMTKDSGVWP